MTEPQRVVTVHVDIECIVEGGDATPDEVGMFVVDMLTYRDVYLGTPANRTWAYPRGVALSGASEKYIDASNDQSAS